MAVASLTLSVHFKYLQPSYSHIGSVTFELDYHMQRQNTWLPITVMSAAIELVQIYAVIVTVKQKLQI